MNPPNKEKVISVLNGWVLLFITLVLLLAAPLIIIFAASQEPPSFWLYLGIALLPLAFISLRGFFTLQPNEARVIILFGAYQGTVKSSGFHWANPFARRIRLSLRARNLNGEKLKVND